MLCLDWKLRAVPAPQTCGGPGESAPSLNISLSSKKTPSIHPIAQCGSVGITFDPLFLTTAVSSLFQSYWHHFLNSVQLPPYPSLPLPLHPLLNCFRATLSPLGQTSPAWVCLLSHPLKSRVIFLKHKSDHFLP